MSTAIEATGAISREPARIVSLIGAVVAAVISLLVAFGVDVSAEQTSAILGVIAVVGPVVVGQVIRGKVFAPASVLAIAKNVMREGINVGVRTAGGPAEAALLSDSREVDIEPEDAGH